VQITSGNADGDTDLCINPHTGAVSITQVGSWQGYQTATFSIVTDSQTYTPQITTPSGGVLNSQLPGDWTRVVGMSPYVTSMVRQQSGNQPDYSFWYSGAALCLRIIDGNNNRPGSVNYSVNYGAY
jgi:hypothetical protein